MIKPNQSLATIIHEEKQQLQVEPPCYR